MLSIYHSDVIFKHGVPRNASVGAKPWVEQVPACEQSPMPVTVTKDLTVYYHKIDTRVRFEPAEYCLLSLEPSGQVSTWQIKP